MKKNQFKIISTIVKIIFMLGFLIFFNSGLVAQNEGGKAVKKKKVRISLDYTNINNNDSRLTATVKTKIDKSYKKVEGVKVNFYFGEEDESTELGNFKTNKKGEAIMILPESVKKIMALQNISLFSASIENDDQFKDKATGIEIKKSYTELTFEIVDSVKQAHLFVGTPDSTGAIIPVEEVEGRIYVKRLFGLLPVSEEFEATDEEGMLIIEFPGDIPGDANGNITIVAQIEDHEEFGNLINSKEINWGLPLKADNDILSRELWSARANAPYWLVFVTNILIVGIWGIIGYIFLQLVKIRKIGREQLES